MKKFDLYDFIKAIRDRRIPNFGGYDYRGAGRGHGRFFLAQTFRIVTRGTDQQGRTKVVISNGAY